MACHAKQRSGRTLLHRTDTTDWEKFEKWAETVPYTFRNPLYHWTHLELKTAFGIDKILNPSTAREIFDECNAKLATPNIQLAT